MQTRCALPETPVCVRLSRLTHGGVFRTVDIVINKPLARVELASRLSVNQKLRCVSCLYQLKKHPFRGNLLHPLPQQQNHLRYWTHRRMALRWGAGLHSGARYIEVLQYWALKKIMSIDTTPEHQEH